jgi:hypothetical protein
MKRTDDWLGGGPTRRYRGSKKRLARIRVRDNIGPSEVILLLVVLIILGVIVPWLAIRGHHH